MSVSRKSNFFDLPREVRDIIYQLILQHEGPLLYLPASAQKGRRAGFYTSADTPNEQNQIKYVNKLLWKETAGLEIKHNAPLFCTQPETNTGYSISCSSRSSSRIRAFCVGLLSTASCFHICIFRRRTLRCSEQQSDLQHGAVAPEVTSQTEGLTLLLNFLQNSCNEWILRLRNIYVRSEEVERYIDNGANYNISIDVENKTLSGVFGFCRQNQNITVFMIVSNFGSQMDASDFLFGACYLLTSSRKDIPAELKFMSEHLVRQKRSLDLKLDLGDEIPANFRLYPDGKFRECIFREEIKETSRKKNWLDLGPFEEELVRLAKSFYEKGLG